MILFKDGKRLMKKTKGYYITTCSSLSSVLKHSHLPEPQIKFHTTQKHSTTLQFRVFKLTSQTAAVKTPPTM